MGLPVSTNIEFLWNSKVIFVCMPDKVKKIIPVGDKYL